MASSTDTLTPELRAQIADYRVLEVYNLKRMGRYGDMAYARRNREIERLGDAIVTAGAPVDRDGQFPASTPDELREAFERTLRPRYRRFVKSPGVTYHGDGRMTGEARASMDAWVLTARALGVTL